MSGQYPKAKEFSGTVFCRKEAEETDREIGESYRLTKKYIQDLVVRLNCKARLIINGSPPLPQSRSHKNPVAKEQQQGNELVRLRMQVELLRNFLSEAGRR